MIAALGLGLGVGMTGRWLSARNFERSAPRAIATVDSVDTTGDRDLVTVAFDDPQGDPHRADIATDNGDHYHQEMQVQVLYDAASPDGRVEFAAELYDPSPGFVFGSAFLIIGLIVFLNARRWTRRVTRVAEENRETYAMSGRFWRAGWRDRWYLSLYPLDAPAGDPVVSYALMPGQDPDPDAPSVQPAEARGEVADGKVVVARVGEDVQWPVRRARVSRRLARGALRPARGKSPKASATYGPEVDPGWRAAFALKRPRLNPRAARDAVRQAPAISAIRSTYIAIASTVPAWGLFAAILFKGNGDSSRQPHLMPWLAIIGTASAMALGYSAVSSRRRLDLRDAEHLVRSFVRRMASLGAAIVPVPIAAMLMAFRFTTYPTFVVAEIFGIIAVIRAAPTKAAIDRAQSEIHVERSSLDLKRELLKPMPRRGRGTRRSS